MIAGIFGGSFDPVHNGHINLALSALETGMADKVVFVPAANQPFKQERTLADGLDRIEMIRLATEDIKGMEISTYELEREDEISYTIKTLRAMKDLYGANSEIRLIMGGDAFLKIHLWHNAEELLRDYPIILGIRPGYNEEKINLQMEFLRKRYNTVIHSLKNRKVDISATELRKEFLKGGGLQAEAWRGKIPDKVREYIIEKGIYN